MKAYLIQVATLFGIQLMMTWSFNLSVGYTGLLNLGHIGLLGFGGYASAILTTKFDQPLIVGIIVAIVLCALLGFLLSLPSKKIKGDYYALVTLGFMFVAQATFINWDSLTRGTLGIPGIPRPEALSDHVAFLWFVALIAVIIYIFLDRLVSSPFGRALESVRDDQEVAEALGKPSFKLKIYSMVISGAIVGLSGALLAHFIKFISPNTFWFDYLVIALAAMIVGGMASMRGSVVGLLILFFITEPIRFLDLPDSVLGPLRLIIYMAILLLIVVLKPKGVMGRAQLED